MPAETGYEVTLTSTPQAFSLYWKHFEQSIAIKFTINHSTYKLKQSTKTVTLK